jgi:hypothetical protein
LSRGDLKISANKRYLVHADGTPFFYLSDTNWNFFHRARREDADKLLEIRRQQGFTVIAGPPTGILDGLFHKDLLSVPNAYGDLPFVDRDFSEPAVTPGADPLDPEQYDYWDHVDYLIDLAERKGIHVGLMLAWNDHYRNGLLNVANARSYGRFLGRRYGGRRNIIWVLGGDTGIDGNEGFVRGIKARIARNFRWIAGGDWTSRVTRELFDELAAGIKEAESRPHLMTYHPSGPDSSSRWFHDAEWLDFNMSQSGHFARDVGNYDQITADYDRRPIKPTMDGENRYEDHVVGGSDPDNGWFNDYDNRQAAYWGLFAGGHGHTYGNRGVWQMYEPGRERYGLLRYYWYDAMNLPGAWDMLHVRNLMLSRPVLSRVPDQSLVEDPLSGADHVQATRGDGYALIYAATGRKFMVELNKISGDSVIAWWFDPRTGRASRIDKFPNRGKKQFDPPGVPGRGNDWVLVLDDAMKNYPPPGVISTQRRAIEAPN